MMTTLNIVLLLLNAAFIGTGIYFSSYLKKKAENLATREDFEELRRQTASLTQITKEIEAQISGELWDRQKRWELRREVLFEIVKRLGELKDALTALIAVYKTDSANRENPQRTELRLKNVQRWLDASAAFDSAGFLLAIACREDVYQTVVEFSIFARDIGTKTTEWDADTLENGVRAFGKRMKAFTETLRTELDAEKRPTPQSSAS